MLLLLYVKQQGRLNSYWKSTKVPVVLKRIILLSMLATALVACGTANKRSVEARADNLPTGIELVKQHTATPGKVTIPYTKYALGNGLTVVLHQDNSDPLVHVDVTYHVGSAREEYGKSGFAHFFEHMMFQGSKNVADEQHFKLITEAGGDMNGTTNADRTNYYQTVPANQLEKVLWLEADRMGFLLQAVTQQKFEVQRETVKNERGQNYDNRPYGLRSERNSEALYPLGHPYSWSTIGYVEDLDRVSVDDLKGFFQRWYGPNNAVITIGGDIDTGQTLEWIKKYFGPIPAGPEVFDAEKNPVTLDQDKFVTLEDQVHLPLVQMTFPTVHVRHEDEAPLDVLSDILGGGKTSLFYKNLVKDNHAVQAFVSHPCSELACEFQLLALANPAKSTELAQLKKRIDETLLEFESRGVNQDDLNRTKVNIEASTIFGLQSVSGKVSTLASNQVFEDEPDLVQYDLDRYNGVTAADVMRVYNRYIKGKAKVVLSIVPKGQVALAVKPETFSMAQRVIQPSADTADIQSPEIKDTFDRSKVPLAGTNPVVKIPEYWQQEFDNGIKMLGHTSEETPTVSIVFSMEGGSILEPPEKAGLASLTARMMNESTKTMSNEELSNQMALLGSQISFSAGVRYTQVRVSSLRKNLDKTLVLLKQKLFSPGFLEEDFVRLQQRTLQSKQQQLNNPSALASRGVSTVLYGKKNRVSLPVNGTISSIQNIELDDVKQFYSRFYSPQKANLVVVGDIALDDVKEKLSFLKDWQGPKYELPEEDGFIGFEQPAIYLIDKPDAAQSVVKIFKPSLPYDATGEYFRTKLMNFALGGNFNSRINLNLREDKGYTYGASTGFAGGKVRGRFQAEADLKKDNTADGIHEFFSEITQFATQGATKEEMMFMRSAYTQSEALSYETPYNKSAFLRRLVTFDLDKGFRDKQIQIIESISLNEINKLAKKHLDISSMQVVVVGDAKSIKEELESLGRPVISLEVSM